MLEIIIIGFITIALILLYCLINRSELVARLPAGFLQGGDIRKRKKLSYMEYFRENNQTRLNNNIIVQILPLLGVLSMVLILGNHFIYFGTVMSGSMEPLFTKGDLVLMQTIDKEPHVGDIISFRVRTLAEPVTHRIVDIDAKGKIITKGDANANIDEWSLGKEHVAGKAVVIANTPLKLKGLGKLLIPESSEFSIMKKTTGAAGFVMVFDQFRAIQPLLIFFMMVVYLLVLIETRVGNNVKIKRNGKKNNHIEKRNNY